MEIDLLTKSGEYIREGRFEKAQIILRRILSENPNQAKAIELTGDLSLKLERIQEAIQRYDNASNKYMNNNKFAEAVLCLEKIMMIDKTNDEVVARLADLYRFYGLSNRSIKAVLDLCGWALDNKEDRIFVSGLRKIVELQTKNLPLRLSYAKVLLAIERKQDAQDELRKLKTMAEEAHDDAILEEVNALLPQPDGGEELDPKSRIELGNLLYEIGSKDEAIVEFEKAVTDLVATGDTEEATSVLNRILEIDPNNKDAAKQLEQLQGGGTAPEPVEAPKEAAPAEETTAEIPSEEALVAEAPSEQEQVDESIQEPAIEEAPSEESPAEPASELPSEEESISSEQSDVQSGQSDTGLDMFHDLGQDIEGFVPASESPDEETPSSAQSTEESLSEDDVSQLEGQIADIEFLLKETEKAAKPSFEISKEFDDFRKSIVWQEEDPNKLLQLARMAYENDLYKTALKYVEDIRDKKETWPSSLEIHGGSLVKLGQYNNAKKNLAAALIFEGIQENEKIELRYLLASAYEGLGDFDNAMREIERIISINPNYRDVREIYALLGGKELSVAEPTPSERIQERTAPIPSMAHPETESKPIPQPSIEPGPELFPQAEHIEKSNATGPQLPEAPPKHIEQMAPVEEPRQSEDTYPTIIEEIPSGTVPPSEPIAEVPKKKPAEPSKFEEPPGENIAFL